MAREGINKIAGPLTLHGTCVVWVLTLYCVLGGLRVLRQIDPVTTSEEVTTPSIATPPSATTDFATPRPTSGKGSNDAYVGRLIGIVIGTLVGTFVLVFGLGVATVLAVVWGCKIKRRRRIQRDLVLRTKHDIFEGVPNYIASESTSDRNVSDSPSPLVAGGGSTRFDLTAAPAESTLLGVATDIQDYSIKSAQEAGK